MALSVYTPTGIVHETSVDFTKRVLTEPVHLVQYDESLPVVAVTCLDAGQYMTLTALDTVSIRMDKGDGTFIYNPALGVSADGHIVYIQITLQMTVNYGRFEPVIELLRDGGYGASSPIPMFIDANPVPNEAIQSTSQWESLNDIVARANAIVAGDAVEFTEAETRENINSGENLITMFGKIKKWFSDLSRVGSFQYNSKTSSINFNGTTRYTGVSLTLQPGIYVIKANIVFRGCGIGRQGITITDNNADTAYNGDAYNLIPIFENGANNYYYNVTQIAYVTEQKAYYVMAYDQRNESVEITAFMEAVCIK